MYRQLTMEEREIISQMNYADESQAAIARRLKRHPSTISRELKRNSTHDGYFAVVAQSYARVRRQVRWWGNRKMEQDFIMQFVIAGLEKYWSPEQIAGRLRLRHRTQKKHVSHQTIYDWIKRHQNREHWESFLRRGGQKRRRRTENPEKAAACIANRPDVVDRRTRFGDWEGDTIVGHRQRGGLVTLVERRCGYLLAGKVSRRKANPVRRSIERQMSRLPAELKKTLTLDNGTEFSQYQALSDNTSISIFFARPYCSWERGTNENTNGLICQFFPKGTDFDTIPSSQIRRAKQLINDRPRKRLGYRTPSEVFNSKLQRCS